jgi:hypothetical protein
LAGPLRVVGGGAARNDHGTLWIALSCVHEENALRTRPEGQPWEGITGWDWMWILLGVFLDVLNYQHAAYKRRPTSIYRDA